MLTPDNREGIISGYPDGSFRPDKPILRCEITALFQQYAAMVLGLDTSMNPALLDSFSDSGDVSPWSERSMSWAVGVSLMRGEGDMLYPDRQATRAEAVAFIYNFDKVIKEASDRHFNATLSGEEYDVFAPNAGVSWAYRYGPSAIVNQDGSIDMFFASLGAFYEADFITYSHSPDGGQSWENERIVLQPTPDSDDSFSCCDPGVIYFDGYYYIGYTSTTLSSGYCNSVFVARSKNASGPYEKWNGSGWGGDPKALIRYDGSSAQWGAGEVSFVEKDGTVYIFYTLRCESGDYTMLATAPSGDENWCASVTKRGVALKMETAQSGSDVKYCDELGEFVLVGTVGSFTDDVSVCFYSSSDGLNFEKDDTVTTGIHKTAHNIGMSGSPDGHIRRADPFFIAYAYGASWGRWATCVASASYGFFDYPDYNDENGERKSSEISDRSASEPRYVIGVTTRPHHYQTTLSSPVKIVPYQIDNRFSRTVIGDTENVVFSGYDPEIVEFSGMTAIPGKAGSTFVTMTYGGFSVTFKLSVYPDGTNTSEFSLNVTVFESRDSAITVSPGDVCRYQIRMYAVCDNGRRGEIYISSGSFPARYYPLEYTGYDGGVISVDESGVITPISSGTTEITVNMLDKSYVITVTVV